MSNINSAANSGAPGVRHVTIDAHHSGQRLDNFLMAQFRGAPRSLIYRILRKGEVRVNKGRASASQRLKTGDVVRLPPLRMAADHPRPKIPTAWIEQLENAIIHEDDCLLVINKPPGLAVHGGSGVPFGVIDILRASRGKAAMLELAHRLDRDTSGCLLLAKSREVLLNLQAQMKSEGTADKRYRAVVKGRFKRGKGRDGEVLVDAPLRKNTLKGGERMVLIDPNGKPAQTVFRLLEARDSASLVEAQLLTGRTHQVRVHASHLGHPIVGDNKYGDAPLNREIRKPAGGKGFSGMALHAASLRIAHPISGVIQTYKAPLPESWQPLLDQFQLKKPAD